METVCFKPEVGWWVYAIIPFMFLCCMAGPILTGSDYLLGFLLSVPFCIFILSLIITTRYAIRGREFGVNTLYRWSWFPIDNIESITHVNSILASAALSTDRIAIRFKDRKVLKSAAPLEISPKDRTGFISALLKINPEIQVNV